MSDEKPNPEPQDADEGSEPQVEQGIPIARLTEKYERIVGQMATRAVDAELGLERMREQLLAEREQWEQAKSEYEKAISGLSDRIGVLEDTMHRPAAPSPGAKPASSKPPRKQTQRKQRR